jgi:heptosyltransferase-3
MVDSSVHVVVEQGRLLAPWFAQAEDWSVVAPPDVALPADVEGLLMARPVVVHVPSMQRYKQWPLEHYRTVIRALVDAGKQVVLTGGPTASDRASAAEVCAVAESPHVLDLSGRLDFAQLATLLRRAALYIGPDTSVTHLAAGCGTKTIALFGPTPPERWGPWPAGPTSRTMPPGDISAPGYLRRAERQRVGRVIVLQGPGACVPCGRAGCEDRNDSRSDCLDGLGPERVVAEALRLLDGSASALDDLA